MTPDKKTLDLAREWAEHVQYGKALDDVQAAADVIRDLPDEWVDADTLRKYIADWRDGLATAPRGNYEAEMLDDLEALLPATGPRPEDVPAGEPWIVEYGGHKWVGTREEGGRTDYEWSLARLDGVDYNPAPDDEVTLIARLVPETTEQDTETAFDPAYTYRDKDGDTWERLDGRWIAGDTHDERVAERVVGEIFPPGHVSLPAEYGPYTRIEDTK